MKAVLISCFNWYKKRLEPIREVLLKQGYEVKVFISDFDHLLKRPETNRYIECTYIHVPEYRRNISMQRVHSHLSFGKSISSNLEEYCPDIIYCLIPPNNVGESCKKYKERHPNTKLIIDIIDLWPESMPIGQIKNSYIGKKWENWRNSTIQVADYVFTECDLFKEKLDNYLIPEKTSTLYLFKEQTKEEKMLVRTIVEQKEKNEHITKLAYLGSMNSIIDIEGICEVIKQFQKKGFECELHAIGNGESKTKFQNAISATNCKSYFYGPVFDEAEKIKILATCDYALNMMKKTVNVGLTIKSIDYLSYGLPLINNIQGDTWRIIEEEKIGFNIPVSTKNPTIKSSKEILNVYLKHFSKDAFMKTIESVLN